MTSRREPQRRAPACRLPKTLMLALGLAVLASLPPLVEGAVVSAELSELSRKLVASRSAANFSALQQYADSAAGIERHIAQYAIAMARYAAKDYGTAESALEGIPVGTAWLAEHAAYLRARCIVLAEDFERALGPLARFIGQYPDSRFRPRAERLQVESLLRLKRLQQARALLSKDANRLADPVRLFLSGRVEHVDGNVQRAISLYRAAYYFYPFSDQAEAAEAHLNRLRTSMGKAYPAAPASRRLERAERLYEGRSYAKASAEYTRALNAGLAGTAREIALVRRGGTDYHRRRTPQAYAALARLRLNDPDLNAERLYFLCALERRQGVVEPMLSSVDKLAKRHPRSPWYQEALLSVGNFYYLKDDRREYIRWFQRLEQAFPRGKHAPYAHWKVCWRAWLDDSRHRRQLLTDHIERFPGAPTAAGALYWMGRLHEEEILPSEAQGYYRAIVEAFPHYYYALLARQRLGTHDGGRVAAKVSAEIRSHLPDRRMLSGDPQEATRALLETGTALDALGFADDARASFHLVDYRQPDSHLAGLRLGRLHSRREEHFLALRAMKRFMIGYLRFPMESLDVEYWRLLFPLGWEDQLRARSERHDLDPYLVAALIRQESEFHPGARSRAGALGLMQIMPRTGRTLFRRLGIPGYSSRKLTVPDLSLRLGTFHLKEVLAKFDGELEKALAGYNAGENRITQWMELGPFEEAGEFVETIPLSETRGYVQAVLRNRAMYERLYGD